ncbi:MAG: hypothetical protein PHT94_03350 [Candidatus Nanoarchaeia archaeon]|nr:hypothetical protein [Candidatus Nanoarchaeia archaeon]
MSYYDDLKVELNKKRLSFFDGEDFSIVFTLPNYEKFKELSYIRILFFLDLIDEFSKENFVNIKFKIVINDLYHSLKSVESIDELKEKNKKEFEDLLKRIDVSFNYELIFSSEIKDKLYYFYIKNFKKLYSVKYNYNEYYYIDTSQIQFKPLIKNDKLENNNKRTNPRDFSLAIFDRTSNSSNEINNFYPTTSLVLSYLFHNHKDEKNIFVYSQYSYKLKKNLEIIQESLKLSISKEIMFSPVASPNKKKRLTIDDVDQRNYNRLRLILLHSNPEKTAKLDKTSNELFAKLIFLFKETYYETSFIYNHTKPKYITMEEEKVIRKLKQSIYFSKYFATEELNYSKSVVILKKIIGDIYSYINQNEIHSKQVIYEITNFLRETNAFFKLFPKDEKMEFYKIVNEQQSLIDEYIDAKKNNKYALITKIDVFFEKFNLKIKSTPYGYFLLQIFEDTPLLRRNS